MKWDPIRFYTLIMFPVLVAVALFFSFKQERDIDTNRMVNIGGAQWEIIAVADTPSSRAQGLSGRDSLCDRCVMIFQFSEPGRYGFWMKGMRFPIDIAWIQDGVIIHIERDIPADSKETFLPEQPADTVIEVNAGELKDVPIGAEVTFR